MIEILKEWKIWTIEYEELEKNIQVNELETKTTIWSIHSKVIEETSPVSEMADVEQIRSISMQVDIAIMIQNEPYKYVSKIINTTKNQKIPPLKIS